MCTDKDELTAESDRPCGMYGGEPCVWLERYEKARRTPKEWDTVGYDERHGYRPTHSDDPGQGRTDG